jgi:hypothetical protein
MNHALKCKYQPDHLNVKEGVHRIFQSLRTVSDEVIYKTLTVISIKLYMVKNCAVSLKIMPAMYIGTKHTHKLSHMQLWSYNRHCFPSNRTTFHKNFTHTSLLGNILL